MQTKSPRLITILLVLIILPLVGYFVYELSQANENEELITSVYEEQLQSVLFSVNQYSNDLMNSLMDRIEYSYNPHADTLSKKLVQQVMSNGYQYHFLIPIPTTGKVLSNPASEAIGNNVNRFITNHPEIIDQLIQFKTQGYRKIEPAGMITDDDGVVYQVILSVLEAKEIPILFVGLIKPESFVEEVLAPKMQQIARSRLVLMMQREGSDEVLYSTEPITTDIVAEANLWLFPDYRISASPKNVTIGELVYERLSTNLLAIALLISLMTIGAILIYRNLQKEVQLNQAKSDFVSNVSHELRTPLALIRMFAETLLLKRVNSEAKQAEYLEIIYKETNRLTTIVNRILNFSRIEANRRVYHKAKISLTTLVEEMARDYSYHLESNDFELSVHLPDEEVWIDADREAIYEGLIILVDNAMKYSDEQKKIDLSIKATDKQVKLAVRDQGMGISSERLPHIFEKFYRVSDNDRYVAQGAGLGLSILKHIMDAHEGDIQVTSKPGEGSTFTLVFKRL